MKKLSILLATFLCAVALNAKTIYLNTGGNTYWGQASPEFFIHAWGENDISATVHMTVVPTDAVVFAAEIPDGCTSCLFTRQKTGSTEIAWSGANLWNKTENLTITDNCYTITGWDSNRSYGTWSTYTPSTDLPTYYITGNANLVGAEKKEWDAKAIELGNATADAPATYTFTTLPADTCRLKVTNGTWTSSLGYTALDTEKSSANIQTDADNNIVFVPKAANTEVKLTFTFNGKITLTGDFQPEHVNTLTAYYVNTTSWDKVYAYVYVGENNNTWPGVEMTKTELTVNGYDVYSYEFAETYTHIIFNNNDGKQTGNLTIDTTKLYFSGDIWYASLDEIPCVPEYGIMVGEEFKAFSVNPVVEGEYMLTGVSLTNGTTFTLYNTCTETGWTVALKEGSTDNVTIVDKKYVAGAGGNYDFYFTPSLSGDVLYIGYSGTTPTSVVTLIMLDYNAPMYNLLGQQVDATYRGVVFQNGTKFFLQ